MSGLPRNQIALGQRLSLVSGRPPLSRLGAGVNDFCGLAIEPPYLGFQGRIGARRVVIART